MNPHILARAIAAIANRKRAQAQADAARALGWAKVAVHFDRLVEWDGHHQHPHNRFEAQQLANGRELVRVRK